MDELLALASKGAKITTEERPEIHALIEEPEPGPTEIVQFDQLVEKLAEIGNNDALLSKLDAMAKANESLAKANESLAKSHVAMAQADETRSKAQLEVLATLQALIRSGNVTKSHTVDLSPLKSVLREISKNNEPVETKKPVYEFNIARNRHGGFIDKIVATPKY